MVQILLDNPPTEGRRVNIREQDYTYILLSVSSECKLFLIILSDKIRKECIYQVNGHIQCIGDFINALYQGYHMWHRSYK